MNEPRDHDRIPVLNDIILEDAEVPEPHLADFGHLLAEEEAAVDEASDAVSTPADAVGDYQISVESLAALQDVPDEAPELDAGTSSEAAPAEALPADETPPPATEEAADDEQEKRLQAFIEARLDHHLGALRETLRAELLAEFGKAPNDYH